MIGPALLAMLATTGGTLPECSVLIQQPVWQRRPTPDEISALTPRDLHPPLRVETEMTCRVGADGRLSNCAASATDPAQGAYADALDRLAPLFRLDRRSVPAAPACVKVKVVWSFGD